MAIFGISCLPSAMDVSRFYQKQGSGPEELPSSATRSGRTRITIHWGALAASAERIRLSHIEAGSKTRLIQLRNGIGTTGKEQTAVDVPARAALVIQKERWEC